MPLAAVTRGATLLLLSPIAAASPLQPPPPPTSSGASWRLRVQGGASCNHQPSAPGGDVWPTAGHSNSTPAFDVYLDHADAVSFRAPKGCSVTQRSQGTPGRSFLVPDGYTPPEEMVEAFAALALAHPGRARLLDLTAMYGAPTTAQGRSLFALKVSDNVGEDEDEPNLLLVAMHHAREIMGPETVLYAARQLLEGEGEGVEHLLERNQIYLAWDWNPDGWRHVFNSDNNWRKNRRPNPDGSFGVDLNRNYPFGFDFWCGGSQTPSNNDYRGPGAASEPETQVSGAPEQGGADCPRLDSVSASFVTPPFGLHAATDRVCCARADDDPLASRPQVRQDCRSTLGWA
jgi:hypothetical protein